MVMVCKKESVCVCGYIYMCKERGCVVIRMHILYTELFVHVFIGQFYIVFYNWIMF